VLPLVMARDDALHTGDLSFVREHFDGLVASALGPLIDGNGLVKTDEVLIDWPPGQRDRYVLSEYNSVANAFAYHGLRTLVELATWLGRHEDAAAHTKTAAALKESINMHMWNGTAFCDGICTNVSHTAFHSTMYLLAFDAVADANVAAAWSYLRGRINPPFSARDSWPPPPPVGAKNGLPCSSYAAQFALMALYRGNPADHGEAALAVLTSNAKNTWRHMLERGATTTMEAWDTDEKPNLTWSHVWSASPGFIIPWLLFGLMCTAPGCTELTVRPAVGGLAHGSFALPTVKGPVHCSFLRDAQWKGSLVLTLTLPVGIVADVALPAPEEDGVAAAGRSSTRSPTCVPLTDGSPYPRVRREAAYVVAVGLQGGREYSLSLRCH
jgi:alpha-L-rhamnosidase